MSQQLITKYRKDYKAPDYLINTVDLHFELDEAVTTVTSKLTVMRNPAAEAGNRPLVLQGEDMHLESVKLNGQALAETQYKVDSEHLTLNDVPVDFELEIVTTIKPQENLALEGLYKSNNLYCTQCESHGFHKITYFLDRPDVMSFYTTTIVADRKKYPILLSNGNLELSKKLPNGKHQVTWIDPYKKPCYLFALVAGDLAEISDEFITQSKRKVALKIYVEKENQTKCMHAMESVKNAMRWDERAYGREYDLDIFMIVAVQDFNMGAMENKGLNIFNARYILADTKTATDADYDAIEAVVGHEYFHNWTGDRITCRDWFQLSLKEGLTVFREQQFSAAMGSASVKRIADVQTVRTVQFAEDAGPMAHPIRPDSYIEMNNFYTATIYEKGAEVIRMLHTLLTPAGFRSGMDLYFERHDGQAVTCDDFVQAHADANHTDLTQFKLWYSQAGTPELTVNTHYDATQKTYTLTVSQHTPATPGQATKQALLIPIAVGLLNAQGNDMPLQLVDEPVNSETTKILQLSLAEQTFVFINVTEQPTLSFLRNFSAPVKVKYAAAPAELTLRLAHDKDDFNRWDAGQQFAIQQIIQGVESYQQNKPVHFDPAFVEAMRDMLIQTDLDKELQALILTLPSHSYIGDLLPEVDVDAIVSVRKQLRQLLSEQLKTKLLASYELNQLDESYEFTPGKVAQRSLKNACLSYLLNLKTPDMFELALQQYRKADNMTDSIAALRELAYHDNSMRQEILQDFYDRWQHDPLVTNKWFTIQALADTSDVLADVKQLLQHPAFQIKNPNRARALIGAYTQNFAAFHRADGAGYRFLADQIIELDSFNPQVAARMCESLTRWKRFTEPRQQLMRKELERIKAVSTLSKNTAEIVEKALTT